MILHGLMVGNGYFNFLLKRLIFKRILKFKSHFLREKTKTFWTKQKEKTYIARSEIKLQILNFDFKSKNA